MNDFPTVFLTPAGSIFRDIFSLLLPLDREAGFACYELVKQLIVFLHMNKYNQYL